MYNSVMDINEQYLRQLADQYYAVEAYQFNSVSSVGTYDIFLWRDKNNSFYGLKNSYGTPRCHESTMTWYGQIEFETWEALKQSLAKSGFWNEGEWELISEETIIVFQYAGLKDGRYRYRCSSTPDEHPLAAEMSRFFCIYEPLYQLPLVIEAHDA
jgi:hypothetical protein